MGWVVSKFEQLSDARETFDYSHNVNTSKNNVKYDTEYNKVTTEINYAKRQGAYSYTYGDHLWVAVAGQLESKGYKVGPRKAYECGGYYPYQEISWDFRNDNKTPEDH